MFGFGLGRLAMRRGKYGFGLGMMVLMVCALSLQGAGQQSGRPQPGVVPNYSAAPPDTNDPAMVRLREQQKRAEETERHKRMVSDTDKLLELATELKMEVDKSSKDEMSVAAIRNAGDIEKLAHEVKEKMKGN
jgi:hypothetical protein